jgi:hypothetical protein
VVLPNGDIYIYRIPTHQPTHRLSVLNDEGLELHAIGGALRTLCDTVEFQQADETGAPS